MATTDQGLPILPVWCVWVEPLPEGGGSRWDRRWFEAVEAALSTWSQHLSLVRVADAGRAQVLVQRRRPQRRQIAGVWRASHGRGTLLLRRVNRSGDSPEGTDLAESPLEPLVVVQVSPDQRRQAIEATALHELGHAFGIWGHSDEAADAMATAPGAEPVLKLSERDRRTLEWLRRQPTGFGRP
ncbi:peptidase [Synechococcus sp. RSCCF101]|nr:peptidase [Synechococcus sp. RSCCF101]